MESDKQTNEDDGFSIHSANISSFYPIGWSLDGELFAYMYHWELSMGSQHSIIIFDAINDKNIGELILYENTPNGEFTCFPKSIKIITWNRTKQTKCRTMAFPLHSANISSFYPIGWSVDGELFAYMYHWELSMGSQHSIIIFDAINDQNYRVS